jgi:myo-inositol catabolism protein IolS
MKYRRLGKTDLRVSVIGLGTWQFGGEWGKDFTQGEVDRIFDAARETGINLIDTRNGSWQRNSGISFIRI